LSSLNNFKKINTIEGYSFIILVFIAMPLKYYFGYPMATKIAGTIHGALFTWFIYQLLKTKNETPLSIKESSFYFLLSLVPFGSFYTQKLCNAKIESEILS